MGFRQRYARLKLESMQRVISIHQMPYVLWKMTTMIVKQHDDTPCVCVYDCVNIDEVNGKIKIMKNS